MVTQSDPGTEDFGVANAQTMLRQMNDPLLTGFVQRRWMRSKKNIMPEIAWSQLRRRFAPGFKALLDEGVVEGWYDPHNTLQLMTFHWLFIPWLQSELDNYQFRINNTRKRQDKKKVLPHGIPELIHRCPADYGALDVKVAISQDAVNCVRDLYINRDHRVFDLLPASLDTIIEQCYNQLGRPPVERASIWGIYLELLGLIRQYQDMAEALDEHENGNAVGTIGDELPLLQGLQDLHERAGYLGGVGNGIEVEHIQELDRFLDEEPEIGDADNEINVDPSLWVNSFSDDDDSEDEDKISDIL
ncbi:hypothetical protein JVU11DRAFT_9081 [Chiua virens]|nr:hypothetical protein JVU11DRAFT_9081 [Chiua virens]